MVSFVHTLVALGLAMFGSYLLTPVVEQVARRAGVVRVPRLRDVHTRDMPLWGGIAIVISAFFAILLTVPFTGDHQNSLMGILCGSALIAIAGVLDDKLDFPAWAQLLVLLMAGFIVTRFGLMVSFVTNPFGPGEISLVSSGLAVPITMIWIFVITKATDFIDGVDGLAAGVCAISMGTLALMGLQSRTVEGIVAALMAAAVCGSCLGFLRHNFNPARIIMGTAGSQFLGFMLATLSIMSLTKVATAFSLSIAILVLGVPILDAIFVTMKRLVTMQPLHIADKNHVHHRLLRRGLSQRETVLILYAVSLCLCVVALGVFTFGKG